MALSDRLALLITANVDDAVKGFNKVGKAAEKELGKAEDKTKKLGHTMTNVGAGMAAFGGVALVGLGMAAKASEEANLAQVKLQNTITNMPKLAGENAKSFTDLAQAIQSKTAADGDQIVAAEAMLGTFNLTGEQIRNITPLVVDFSRKFGVDMVSAATQVGKALDGNVGALKRNGVSIDEVRFKTDRYGAVQDALSKQVGGFAEAEGKTFAGSLERMKNQLGDLAEGVGGGAVDAFTRMFGAVGKATGALDKFSPGAQNAAGQIATYGSVALIAVGATSTLIGQVLVAKDRFSKVGESVRGYATNIRGASVDTGKLGRSIGGLAAAFAVVEIGVLALDALSDKIADSSRDLKNVERLTAELALLGRTGKLTGELLSGTGTDFKDLAKKIDTVKDASDSFLDQFRNPGDFAIRGELKGAKDDIDALDKSLADLVSSGNGDIAAKAFEHLSEGLKAQGVSAKDIKKNFDDYNDAVGTAGAQSGAAAAGVDDLGGAAEGAAPKVESVADKIERVNDAIDRYLGKALSQEEATDAIAQGFIDLGESIQGLKDLPGVLSAADFKGNSAEALEYREQIRGLVGNYGDLITKTAANKTQANLLANAFLDTAIKMGVPKEEALRYTRVLQGIPARAPTTIEQPGMPRSLADTAALRARLGEIPSSKYTKVTVDISEAQQRVRALQNSLNSLGGGRAIAAAAQANMRAEGGPVKRGQPYIVGEKQAELFVPNQNGSIIPSVPKGLGGAQGTTIHNNWYINGNNAEDIGIQVERILRREAALAGATAAPE